MTTVALLHPGNMGAPIGARLAQAGHTVLWHPPGRSAATTRRATEADLTPVDDLEELLTNAEIVLSIVPAAAAHDLAATVAAYQFDGTYIDANATSPARIHEITDILTEAGATVVDAIISGAPPAPQTTPRIYTSGPPSANDAARRLFTTSGFPITDLGDTVGSASALKMALASYLRTTRLLAALAHALADTHGVTDALIAEAHAFDAAPLADRDYLPSVAARAWRWEQEMRDVATTLTDADLPPALADASTQLYHRLAPAKDNWTQTPEEVLRLLTQQP